VVEQKIAAAEAGNTKLGVTCQFVKKMHVKEGFYGLPRVMPSLWKRMKTASFTKIKGMDLP
jgi:hypothetical protein